MRVRANLAKILFVVLTVWGVLDLGSIADGTPLTGPIFSTPPVSNGSEGVYYPTSNEDLASSIPIYDHQFITVDVPFGTTTFDPFDLAYSQDPPPTSPIYIAATGNILINGSISIDGTASGSGGASPPIGGGFPFTLSTPGTITLNGSLVDLGLLNLSAGTIDISSTAMLNGVSLSPCLISGSGGSVVTLANYSTPTSSPACGGLNILAASTSSGSGGGIAATPEPSTLALFGTGMLLMGLVAARKRKVLVDQV